MKALTFFILRHFLRDGLRTDGETESSTTRISTRISAGKVDTIDSLASKTGIRPLLMIGLIRSKGNASTLREMLEEEKPPGAITQTRRQPESYSLATTKK